jgi:hypothetical protein
MIHPYDNQTQTRWDRGEYKVQLIKEGSTRPMGFCDGSAEDVTALRDMAEAEGADGLQISKKTLKSGREIWTLSGSG